MTHDTGFALNPFHGYLTLAICKPGIRLKAEVGEWICGFDSKELSGSPVGKEKLVYAMKVEEKLSFDEYFEDPRFQSKKPSAGKGRIYLVGDNIYYRGAKAERRSKYHENEEQVKDLKGQYVLISRQFWYFGRCSIKVPDEVKPNIPSVVEEYKSSSACASSERRASPPHSSSQRSHVSTQVQAPCTLSYTTTSYPLLSTSPCRN